MITNRRNFLTKALLGSAGISALALTAGCATNPTTGQPEIDPTVIDAIQAAVAKAAQYIPTVESIINTAASLFPGYGTIVQIGTAAFNTLINALSNVVNSLSPPAQARLRFRLRASSPSAPVVIGTIGAVTVTGYHL